MHSDQSNENWDGIGLGMPISKDLAHKINAFIKYGSIEKVKTIFQLYVPLEGRGEYLKSNSIFSNHTDLISRSKNISLDDHKCAQIYIAEDNIHISSNYERILSKNKIPFKSFLNGLDL